MIWFFLTAITFGGCFAATAPKDVVGKGEKISVPRKRIKFAVELCAANGKVKEIQVKPRELIICGNGAVFRR